MGMAKLEQYGALERDLIQALSDKSVDLAPPSISECPTLGDLRRFEAGKFGHNADERDKLIAHVGVCDRCLGGITRLKRRRVWQERTGFVLAFTVVVLVAIWVRVWHPAPISSGVATLDLRLSFPTRGIENANVANASRVRRDAGRLRLILPPGSEGSYEYELVAYEQVSPAVRGSGRATAENEKVILNLTTGLAHLRPGRYSLALRRDDSGWEYYPIIVE